MSMFWSKKENKRSLPDLPPLNGPMIALEADGRFDFGEVGKHELPSFPDSTNSKGFSQAAIKDAVSDSEEDSIFPESSDNRARTVEMEEWTPSMAKSTQVREIPEFSSERSLSSNIGLGEPPSRNFGRMQEIQRGSKNNDIFVKLDKFYSARKALIDAQTKLENIDQLLRKIREVKMREEQELMGWEKDLMNIKARINDVSMGLFEKVD